MLPSMAEVRVVKSGLFHRGYVPDISGCIDISWDHTVLSNYQFKISNGSNVKQRLFSMCLERSVYARNKFLFYFSV